MQNDDFNIDVVLAEITAFAENMHAKNQHKKKVCLRCMMIIPLLNLRCHLLLVQRYCCS